MAYVYTKSSSVSKRNANKSHMSAAKDGLRPWKKDSETKWVGFGKVRYSNCMGSYTCTNPQCDFKKEYGVTNNTQFEKKSSLYRVCNRSGKYVPCSPRRYVVVKLKSSPLLFIIMVNTDVHSNQSF